MKLSEFDPSLYHSARLRLIPSNTIKQKASEQLPLTVSLTTIPTLYRVFLTKKFSFLFKIKVLFYIDLAICVTY